MPVSRTITVRGVPDPVLRALRDRSAENRRSLNAELLVVLEKAAAGGGLGGPVEAPRGATGLILGVDPAALAAVCRRHHITWLGVFGSHARGEARADSDVDIAVDFAPGMTPGLGMIAVQDALGAVFGGRRVDLVTRRGLGDRRERFLASAVVLHGG